MKHNAKAANDTNPEHGYRFKPPLLGRIVVNERNLLHLLALLSHRPPNVLPLAVYLREAVDLNGGPSVSAALIDGLDHLAIQSLLVPAFLEIVVFELGYLAKPI